MSYQLDVLVSDIPATHLIDLKESDYFKPGDVHDLACHLQQKLAPPQKRTYNLSAFDWEKIAQQVMEVYKEVRIRKGTWLLSTCEKNILNYAIMEDFQYTFAVK